MTKLKRIMISVISVLLLVVIAAGIFGRGAIFAAKAESAENLKVNAKSALLMDYNSGTIVFEQNTKEHLPIASMVKIMTLLLVFEELEAGRLTVDTDIIASEYSTSMGGSQAFLDANSSYKLGELIKSILVASANDSCVAVGEHISGDITSFVDRMNEKAKELNMHDTNFVNCTGLPAPNQYSCANDVALMTREMIKHPTFYTYSTVWMFDFAHPSGRVTSLSNTNKLIKAYEGCDGGKTGFTNEAMFCLSATAKRGNTRLISVVMGAETSKIRNGENAKLFNYGFANYETRQIVFKGIGQDKEYEVKNGKEKTVKLVPSSDFYSFVPKNTKLDVKLEENIAPMTAPVTTGEVKGELKIIINGNPAGSVELISAGNVNKITFIDLINEMINEW